MNRISRFLLVTVAPIALTLGPPLATAQDDPPPGESVPAAPGEPDPASALLTVLGTLTLDLAAPAAELSAQLDAHRAALAEVEAAIAAGGPAAGALDPIAAELRDRIAILELLTQPLPGAPILDGSVDDLSAQRDAHNILLAQYEEAIALAEAHDIDPGPIEARANTLRSHVTALTDAIAAVEAAAAEPEPEPEPEPVIEPPPPEPEPEPVIEAPPPEPAPEPVIEAPEPEVAPQPEPAPPQAEAADEPVVEDVPAAAPDPALARLMGVLDSLIYDLSAPEGQLAIQLAAHQAALADVEAAIANPPPQADVTALGRIADELRTRIAALEDAIAGEPEAEPAQPEAPPPAEAPAQPEEAVAPAVPAVGGGEPVVIAAPERSDVEEQLAAGGNQEAAEQVRTLRQELLGALVEIGRGVVERSLAGPDVQIIADAGDRLVVEQNGQQVIVRSETEELDRLLVDANDIEVIDLGGGWTRTMIFRNDGTRIVTTTDPYGNIAERIRIDPDGTETILIQSASNIVIGQPLPPPPPPPDFNVILPPIQINIAQELYIVEADRASQNDIVAALIAQPVEVVERPYTLEEIRYSDRIRDKVRRIDLTTITFDTGSAAINPDQFDELIEIGQALQEILGMFPNAVFLVEGHADAVGSEYSNLLLSDRRAETVAVALSTNFGIPPENLITQGYGEAFLKIPTLAAERQNRRVALRNITELLFADTPVVEPPRG